MSGAPDDALFGQALAAAQAGRLPQAVALVDRALADAPRDADALALKAALLHQLGRSRDALPLFEAALAQRPDNVSALSNHGAALAALGLRREALKRYDRALALDPANLGARHNRAVTHLLLDDPAGALADARALLAVRPDLLSAQVVEGQALAAAGDRVEAIARFDAVLARASDNAAALQHRGAALLGEQRFAEALADLDRAAALAPSAAITLRRSMALLHLRRLGEALAAADRAADLAPSDIEVHLWRGVVLSALARYADAASAIDHAVALDPNAPLPHLRRAYARLRLSDFAQGWDDYEHRWREPGFQKGANGFVTAGLRARLDPALTRTGLRGRDVLLVGEQAIGDQVMFLSMLGDLVAEAAAVTCVCDARLAALVARAYPAVRVLPEPPARTEGFDRVLAMGSLGRLYRRAIADFPRRAYLAPDAAGVDAWRRRLGPRARRLRVGLSWRGGVAATGGATRSLSTGALAPLLAVPDIEFVSLQFRPTPQERADLPGVRFLPDADIDDFSALGGLALALDHVLSVQTALVHLCGAVGAPCTAMIPFMAEWRYGAHGSAMPWYGSVELIRQPALDDWDSVIAQLVEKLASLGPAKPPVLT